MHRLVGARQFLYAIARTRILIDPIFGKISGLVPRYSEMPCLPEDFTGIDYVILSHAHRDHCDSDSLTKLAERNKFTLLTSLNTGNLVSDWVKDLKFQEAGWYQQYDLKEKTCVLLFCPLNIGATATYGTSMKPYGAVL